MKTEFESKLAGKVVERSRKGRTIARAFVAIGVLIALALSTIGLSPGMKADLVLLDEVNIGDVATEGTGVACRIEGWSHIWDPSTIPAGGWGGFDASDPSNIQGVEKSLRTVWAAEDSDANWATVKLTAKTQARQLLIRALDGLGDDSFAVYVNDRLVYAYKDEAPTWDDPEVWHTELITIKGEGELLVKIVSTAPKWDYFDPWGQLGINWVRVYGVGGFDMYGYNYGARLYVGWLGSYLRYVGDGTQDSWLIMKWSDDWTPMGDEPIGAWVTNHFIWYSDDYDEPSWYGYYTRVVWNEVTSPTATYMIEEFAKIMSVGDDLDEWQRYADGGAYSAGWGAYPDGVPRYVVFQDEIDVYDTATGMLVYHLSLCTASPQGLGHPIF